MSCQTYLEDIISKLLNSGTGFGKYFYYNSGFIKTAGRN